MNSRATLRTLPPELIVYIMHLLQGPCSRQDFEDQIWGRGVHMHHKPSNSWTNVIYASAHLRRVGTSTPELWTWIDLEWSARWLVLSLERSRGLSLTVFARQVSAKMLDIRGVKVMHSTLVRAVALTLDVSPKYQAVPAPLIEALKSSPGLSIEALELSLMYRIAMTSTLFSDCVPHLTTLVIRTTRVD
jgi:hypothetical protein